MEAALYAEVYLICMVIVGLILFWTIRRNNDSAVEIWLRRTLISFFINFASNFLFTLFSRILTLPSPVMIVSAYLLKSCYFVSLIVGVFFWCAYAETEIRSEIFRKKHALLLAIPLAVCLVIPVVNLFTRCMFYITDAGGYRRILFYHVLMILLIFWTVLCAVRVLSRLHRETDLIRKNHLILVSTFPLCMVAAWILSFIGESVPVICVCITVELFCLFYGNMGQQVSMDALTQVNNRQNLLGFMSHKIDSRDGDLWLLMMDVDYFKMINDTFGHLEGDEALILVASCLKRACGNFPKRPYIARYGGDEFIIVLEADESDVRTLCDTIHALTTDAVQAAAKPYLLRLSIGTARYRDGMTIKGFIAEADEKLYEVKKGRLPAEQYLRPVQRP